MHRVHQGELPHRGSSLNFVGADQGNVDISVFLFDGAPGAGPGPHRHPYDEVQFIRSGRGRYVVDGREFEAGERSLRARWQPTFDIGLQLDLAGNSSFLRTTDIASTRAFDVTTLSAASDLSYRPTNDLEFGWRLKVSVTEDVLPTTPRTTTVSTNELRGLYSIQTSGRLRAELERTVAAGTNIPPGDIYSLPYQLTDGYVIGTTWVGRVTLEYRISGNIQVSVTYTGRAQPPTNRVLHLGQAEVRAFF